MSKLVSIIMPAYNAEHTIVRSINSILVQKYKHFELLIIDDKSTDKTLDLCANYQKKDKRIKIYTNNNVKGVSGARNTGIYHAKGSYIAFLDSDDAWHPDKLYFQIKLMDHTGYHVSHTDYYRCDASGTITQTVKSKRLVSFKDMLNFNHIGNLTGIYNVENIERVYQSNIGHEDYDMWLKILKYNNSICVNKPLAYYTVSTDSVSSNKIRSAKWHYDIMSKYFKKSQFIKKIFCFYKYIKFNLSKRIY